VVTGNIEEGIQNSKIIESATLKNVLRLTHYIHSNAFWNAQIEQIAVTNENEFQLVPKIGNHIIEFGAAENIEEKFSKLQTFYKEGLNYVGWNNYKTINLKFDNQVVCTKHTEYEEHN
jgi:cell division protein FtsQ